MPKKVSPKNSVSSQAELVDSQNQTAIIPVAATAIVVTDDLPMTDAEFRRRDELEARIKGNWLEIALDSKEINESKLYRRTRGGQKQTWEEYCKRFYGQSAQYVNRTIRAMEVIETLKTETKVSVYPESVAHAVPLIGLKPDQMAEATEAAFKSAKSKKRNVTAEDFKNEAAKLKPLKPKKPQPPARPEDASEAAAQPDLPAEKTGSVGLQINTVSLVAPVRELFEELKLQPHRNLTNNGTVFTFDGSAKVEQRLLTSLATLLNATGPLDLRITLE